MARVNTARRTTQGSFSGSWSNLYSWEFSETGGANSVTLKLYAGTDNTGIALTPAIKVAAGTSVGEDYAHPKIVSSGSVFLEVTGTGTAEVVIGVA